MNDAHFHYSAALFKELKSNQIDGICNVENEEEFNLVQTLLNQYSFHYSCGIHPWHVDSVSYDSFYPYLEKASIIGEIGLDNVWCNTDLNLQEEVFEKQLQYASNQHKPVILHLKGMEKEALEFIRKYPNQYLVHWYSRYDYLEEYIELGCFFTIGPSIGIDDTVSNVAKKVPLNKMLIESDGIDAIEWALGKRDYLATLQRSLEQISLLKNVSLEKVKKQIEKNFNDFLQVK